MLVAVEGPVPEINIVRLVQGISACLDDSAPVFVRRSRGGHRGVNPSGVPVAAHVFVLRATDLTLTLLIRCHEHETLPPFDNTSSHIEDSIS